MNGPFAKAFELLWSWDADLIECVKVSLLCSVTATAAAVAFGAVAAVFLGRRRFRGRGVLLVVAHTGMAVPTVVIGLVLYSLLSRNGLMGPLGMLYSPGAIILGEFALAFPIIVALVSSSVAALDSRLEMTARTLGAGRVRIFITVLGESREALVAAAMSAFGRLCSELGIAMMVGGNIRHYTRTMTTAIALETAGGEFALALSLGLILLLLALGINIAAQMFQLPRWGGTSDVL